MVHLKKAAKWFFILIIALILLLFVGIEAFDRYISTEQGTRWWYNTIPQDQLTINISETGIRYLSIGDTSKPALMLIHGAPGNCLDWKKFSTNEEIREKYRLLIVERPGYGGTLPKKAEPSIQIQAERIAEILDNETQPATILGHSYGAPIAILLGVFRPEKIKKIFGVAGAYAPEYEVTFSISYYIKYNLFKYILPRMLWVPNVEKLSHPCALSNIVPLYQEVKIPTIIMHSDVDWLVPFANATFLLKHLNPNLTQLIILKGHTHPIQINAPELLIKYILKFENNNEN